LLRELAQELITATVVSNKANAKILFFIVKSVCSKTVYFARYFTKVENVCTWHHKSALWVEKGAGKLQLALKIT
jgi:hypothetical protein